MYGYGQYLKEATLNSGVTKSAQSEKKTKKSYTTPGKELAKKERRIKKLEEQITVLEADTAALQNELNNPANALDYKKLEELQNTLNIKENELFEVMSEWDALMNQ